MKNIGGFIVEEDVDLKEVAAYIKGLPAYKRVKKKIEYIRDRIKDVTSEKVKFFLKDKLSQLIEEKRKIMAVAFYERHKSKATMTMAVLNKAVSFSKKNINKNNKSLLMR